MRYISVNDAAEYGRRHLMAVHETQVEQFKAHMRLMDHMKRTRNDAPQFIPRIPLVRVQPPRFTFPPWPICANANGKGCFVAGGGRHSRRPMVPPARYWPCDTVTPELPSFTTIRIFFAATEEVRDRVARCAQAHSTEPGAGGTGTAFAPHPSSSAFGGLNAAVDSLTRRI